MVPVADPAPGYKSQFDGDAPSQAWIPPLAVYTTLPVAVALISLRVYVRIRHRDGLAFDDYNLCYDKPESPRRYLNKSLTICPLPAHLLSSSAIQYHDTVRYRLYDYVIHSVIGGIDCAQFLFGRGFVEFDIGTEVVVEQKVYVSAVFATGLLCQIYRALFQSQHPDAWWYASAASGAADIPPSVTVTRVTNIELSSYTEVGSVDMDYHRYLVSGYQNLSPYTSVDASAGGSGQGA
ncbi:hypothetical protein PG984_005059 [Apiospora sp. TS-2023a]